MRFYFLQMDWLNDIGKQTGSVFEEAGKWTGEQANNIGETVSGVVPSTLNIGIVLA